MKVLIAPDSFKGALSGEVAAAALAAAGVNAACPSGGDRD